MDDHLKEVWSLGRPTQEGVREGGTLVPKSGCDLEATLVSECLERPTKVGVALPLTKG